MCGIAGVLNIYGEALPDPSVARRMAAQLVHRGPDDDGFFTDEGVAFGFRRLSIIDVDGGHQLMHNEDGSFWCMFNGEVYNYVELGYKLESCGHVFYTQE